MIHKSTENARQAEKRGIWKILVISSALAAIVLGLLTLFVI